MNKHSGNNASIGSNAQANNGGQRKKVLLKNIGYKKVCMNTTIWKAIIAGYIHLKRFIMPSLYLCVRDIHEKSNESSLRPSDKKKILSVHYDQSQV